MFVSDLRHYLDMPADVPGPARRMAERLILIVRAATAGDAGVRWVSALTCDRRPGRQPCPGHLDLSRTDIPPSIEWRCTSCGDDGVISGGVDGAIHRAAGPDLVQRCRLLGGCKAGQAKTTPGFRLAASWIIHTVGPVWRGGANGEPELLASCYRESLARAEEVEAASVAFPAISTGIFGYPTHAAAKIAVQTVRATPSPLTIVRFVSFDEATYQAYEDVLAAH